MFGLPGGVSSDLGHLASFISVGDFATTGSIIVTQTGGGGAFASATLPLFIGTAGQQRAARLRGPANPGEPECDFAGRPACTIAHPGWPTGPDNALRVKIDLIKLLRAQPGGFAFQTPDFDFNNFEPPSLFALLSDPSMLVDGLDRVLLVLQEALRVRSS